MYGELNNFHHVTNHSKYRRMLHFSLNSYYQFLRFRPLRVELQTCNEMKSWAYIGQHLHCFFVYIHSPRLLIPFFCKSGFIISFLFGIVRELIKCESLAFSVIVALWFAFWVRIVLLGLCAKECGWTKVKWGLGTELCVCFHSAFYLFIYCLDTSLVCLKEIHNIMHSCF